LRQISPAALTRSEQQGYSGIAVPKYQFNAESCDNALPIQ